MVTELDPAVENNGLNQPFLYGDIIIGWKFPAEENFRDFDINTWFAESAGLANNTVVVFQALRFNPTDERFNTEVVVQRTLFDSEQNRIHTI